MHAQNVLFRAATLVVGLALAGCAAPHKPLYQWGSYQGALYEYLKSNGLDPASQIARLEAEAQKNAASGFASPPGLHGHLALLYAKMGDDANAIRSLETERRLFPESATYVNFLLRNTSKAAPNAPAGSAPHAPPSASPSTAPRAPQKTSPQT